MLRIGGKAIRGIKGSRNAKCIGYKNIDVTSGSKVRIGNNYGKEFSPIAGNIKVIDSDREFQQFENWWQGNKVYAHLNHAVKRRNDWIVTKDFDAFQDKWAKQLKGKRVIPETKHNGKRAKPLFAVYDGKRCDYREARFVYTGKYCNAVKNISVFKELLQMYKLGEPIMLIDHDGPSSLAYPEGVNVTWDLINDAVNNMSRPYGHAYVIAAMLLSAK